MCIREEEAADGGAGVAGESEEAGGGGGVAGGEGAVVDDCVDEILNDAVHSVLLREHGDGGRMGEGEEAEKRKLEEGRTSEEGGGVGREERRRVGDGGGEGGRREWERGIWRCTLVSSIIRIYLSS